MKIKSIIECYSILFLLILTCACTPQKEENKENSLSSNDNAWGLKRYDNIPSTQVMVVGSYHFAQESKVDELSPEVQQELLKIRNALAGYRPTKIFLEKEPKHKAIYDKFYSRYLKNELDIDTLRPNETLQLGFKLAKQLKHDSIYLFDNQTEFIGSLENFSFDSFGEYAETNDKGFYDKHIETISSVFNHNQKVFDSLPLYERFRAMNSKFASEVNISRMHSYEVRVGIEKSWIGPDWLGRFYRRNIRMASILLKKMQSGDRSLIIVGDNHKWALDLIFSSMPDFEVVEVNKYLK